MALKLTKVVRLDSMPLEVASFTSEGYLKDRPVLTRTGIFEYRNDDGSIRRELRLPEEVFKPESLASYKGKPIVITHDAGLLNKDNVHDNQIGTILSEGYPDGDKVRADIIIHDTGEMEDRGFKELSLGYNLDLDETPGVWNGQPYDAVQRNIDINHLALVKEARAGDKARLNIDSRDSKTKGGKTGMAKTNRADGILSPEELEKAIEEYRARRAKENEEVSTDADEVVEEEVIEAPETEEVIEEEKLDEEPETIEEKVELVKQARDIRDEAGDPKDVDEAMGIIAHQDEDLDKLFDIIDTLLAQRDFDSEDEEIVEEAAEEEVAEDAEDDEIVEEEEIVEDSEDEEVIVEEEEKIDSCDDEKKERMDASEVDRIIRERIKIGMIGRQIHIDGLENMSAIEAKKAIVKAVRPSIRLDGKSVAYVDAAYDCAVEDIKAQTAHDTAYQRKQMFNKDSKESKKDDSAASAYQRMIERQARKNK